ncbi:MAG: MFS transporter [Anaerolineaceae bacterium]|jgi:DHA3 family macrolide efflux protein-like MFS transporter
MTKVPQHPVSDPKPSPHLVEGRPWLINYIPMWAGQAVSILGSVIVQFALIWNLTEKTDSAAVLATGTIVSILPGVILGPFSGALVDRLNRKLIMVISDLLVALFTLVLVVLFALGGIEI